MLSKAKRTSRRGMEVLPTQQQMKVTPEEVKLSLPPSRTVRSEGIHLSNIIRCIATENGILKPEWAEDVSLTDVREITDPTAILRICVGLSWEEWYIPTILKDQGVLDHPGEMQVDGIYMTHDGESVDVIITPKGHQTVPVIHECKATWKSTNTVGSLEQQWMWLTQIKGYCKGAGTRHAVMHVLFMNGDYKYPLQPQLKRWRIEFTQAEIDQSWKMLKEYMETKA